MKITGSQVRADGGGWSNTSDRKRFRSLFVAAAVCGGTLSWGRTIPEDIIPRRWFWIKESKYSTYSTFGGSLYCFRHVCGFTTRSELTRARSEISVGEWAVTYMKQLKCWRMSCDVGRAHSPTFPSLHLRQRSFYNHSVALPTSQLILQHFSCFIYVTAHSPTLISLRLRHRLFTYVTWRAANDFSFVKINIYWEIIVKQKWNNNDDKNKLITDMTWAPNRNALSPSANGTHFGTDIPYFHSAESICALDFLQKALFL